MFGLSTFGFLNYTSTFQMQVINVERPGVSAYVTCGRDGAIKFWHKGTFVLYRTIRHLDTMKAAYEIMIMVSEGPPSVRSGWLFLVSSSFPSEQKLLLSSSILARPTEFSFRLLWI